MHRTTTGALLLLGALAVPAVAQAQEGMPEGHKMDHRMEMPSEGLRAELIADIDALEEKYMGLAKAMAGKYDWRPMDGVRSVGEVFGHVANANFGLPAMAGVKAEMEVPNFEQASEADIMEGLEHSFMHVRHAIAQVSDEQLEDATKMFGQDATKRQVLTLLVTHMHEHLGQSIAYARTNGVAPPWSG
jgi:uncharacterized damage-inducible protein DinB